MVLFLQTTNDTGCSLEEACIQLLYKLTTICIWLYGATEGRSTVKLFAWSRR